MRIAFMAYDRANYMGGPIINARRLLPELVNKGHTVLAIIAFKDKHPNADWIEKQGIQVIRYAYNDTIEGIKVILQSLKEFKPDVFVPNIIPHGGYAAYWLKKAGIPSVITHRSDDERNWCTAKTFGIKKWKWKNSALVCVSEYLKRECLKLAEDDLLIRVIPSGVPIPDQVADQTTDNLKVVYSGRLVQNQKRIWDTIEAFVSLAKTNNQLEFTIIGEGDEKENLIKYVKENKLDNRIIFTGRLTGDMYQKELMKHNVIVLLSDYEGTPGSIMDGMACGLVPVCYNFKGISELVLNGQNGLIVKDRKEAFFDALHRLQKNKAERITFSKNARKQITEKYSLEKTTDAWLELFNLLMNKKHTQKCISLPRIYNLPPVPQEYINGDDEIRIHRSFFWKVKNFILHV